VVEHKHHRRDEPLEIVDEGLAILTPDYGLSKASHCRLDRAAVKFQHHGAGLLRMLDKSADECRLADPRDPVEVDHPGLSTQ
jgi:hypothetical protein